MNANDVFSQAQDALSARRVFGKPYERDGTIVLPVARVRGFGGGGGGEGSQGESGSGSGSGGGIALTARPVGVYVVRPDRVQWRPAVDATSIILRFQAALILVLLFLLRRSG